MIPYDGNDTGTYIPDAMPLLYGEFVANGLFHNNPLGAGVLNSGITSTRYSLLGSTLNNAELSQDKLIFDSSRVFSRIANEVRVASMSIVVYMSY